MKINVVSHEKNIDKNLINFLLKIKKNSFVFSEEKNILKFKDNKILFVFSNSIKKNEFLKIFKNIETIYNNKKTIFLASKKLQKDLTANSFNFIFYPIRIDSFENTIFDFFKEELASYENLFIKNDNILIRSNDDKQIFLTETESKILKILFNQKIIDKNYITKNILKQSPDVVSKSLESHLYRLRKKILTLNKKIQIISKNDKIIEIK
tara:strand:- start:1031 stop:1657 length:627 start_codon:yes stop_codon:yes gene_type:complete